MHALREGCARRPGGARTGMTIKRRSSRGPRRASKLTVPSILILTRASNSLRANPNRAARVPADAFHALVLQRPQALAQPLRVAAQQDSLRVAGLREQLGGAKRDVAPGDGADDAQELIGLGQPRLDAQQGVADFGE